MKLIEDATTEFKREFTEEIRKSIIAFANTNGGNIYIGICDDGTVVGVSDVDSTMLKVTNLIKDCVKPDITLFVSYQVEHIEGKPVLKVIVQKGTACPYYVASKGIRPEGVYVRHGASSIPATATHILKMIKESDGEKYEEIRSLNQNLTFIDANKEFEARETLFESGQQKTLKLINTDGVYTNLALLLSDQCPHTIKVASFDGLDKAIFKDRREFTGSLLKQLNDVFGFIDMHNRIHAEVKGLYRVDSRDYPVEAVREALLNAIIHSDYSFHSSTLISILDDRIEIVSIGGLVTGISLDDIMLGGVSFARNPNLANVFYRLELIEAYGTGMQKIMRSYGKHHIEPKVEVTSNAFKIVLPNTNVKQHVGAKGSRDNWGIELSENEEIIIKLLKKKKYITRKDVEGKLSIGQAMSARILSALVTKGAIVTVGKGKSTKYTLS